MLLKNPTLKQEEASNEICVQRLDAIILNNYKERSLVIFQLRLIALSESFAGNSAI